MNRLRERWKLEIGQLVSLGCARLPIDLSEYIAFDEDGAQPKIAAKFNIGEAVADHDAAGGFDLWKLSLCLFEEPGKRLAAVALALRVRAEIEPVDMRPMRG